MSLDDPDCAPAKPWTGGEADLRTRVIDVLKTVYDPEVPVDIYELGLIYNVDIDPEAKVAVRMTLTSPACPSAEAIPPEVEYKVRGVKGVKDVTVEVVWEPPWKPDMMTDAAKLKLNLL